MKKLLLIALSLLFIVASSFGQKIWDFGNNTASFPLNSTGVGTGPFPITIDGLSITGISTNANMAVIEASPKTFTNSNNVAFTFANRLKFNGAGYTGAAATDVTPLVNMPTQRYLSFNVSGNSTIYMIGITGSSSSARKIFVTDGTNLIGSVDFPASSGPVNDGTITYTGGATTLYVFCNSSCSLHYLSATNVITAVNNIFEDNNIAYNGTEITNNKNLHLSIFDATGKRILNSRKSISTSNLPQGLYMVRAEGYKDVLKFIK